MNNNNLIDKKQALEVTDTEKLLEVISVIEHVTAAYVDWVKITDSVQESIVNINEHADYYDPNSWLGPDDIEDDKTDEELNNTLLTLESVVEGLELRRQEILVELIALWQLVMFEFGPKVISYFFGEDMCDIEFTKEDFLEAFTKAVVDGLYDKDKNNSFDMSTRTLTEYFAVSLRCELLKVHQSKIPLQ